MTKLLQYYFTVQNNDPEKPFDSTIANLDADGFGNDFFGYIYKSVNGLVQARQTQILSDFSTNNVSETFVFC